MSSHPQLTFDDAPRIRKHFASLDERFQAFHRANPHIYRLLVMYAREARDRGFEHYGMKALWEVVRWNEYVRKTDETFKANNSFTSRYARMIMAQEKDLAGFFETRKMRS